MTNVAALDAGLQRMRGGYASLRGKTYDVYRLSSATPSTGILSGTPVIMNFPCSIRRTRKIDAIEGTIFDLICVVGTCDNRKLEIGDVLVETGEKSLPNNIFTFIQARETRESLFIRTEFLATIGDALPHSGQSAQQPSSGWIVESGYGGSDDGNIASVQLSNGVYSFGASGSTGAQIPCGIVPLNRVRDGEFLGTPTDLARSHYVAFVPDLGSAVIERNNRILTSRATFQILAFQNSSGAGVWGNVCLCEEI